METPSLTPSQDHALKLLTGSRDNLFLTGSAGTGKSFLISRFMDQAMAKGGSRTTHPIVASTGAAAILVGGRTFHSFFGLGIMEGGVEKSVDRALRARRVVKQVEEAQVLILDEISMIPGQALVAAEWIARLARDSSSPWGGLRVIAIGDFYQLPPVSRAGAHRDWSFLSEVWERSEFTRAELTEVMRTQDSELMEVLGQIRTGAITPQVSDFLNRRIRVSEGAEDQLEATRLFPLRAEVEGYNLSRLASLEGEARVFVTEYRARTESVEASLRRDAPIPEELKLKPGALVMLRRNDPNYRYVNGSLGRVREMDSENLLVQLLSGNLVEVPKVSFEMLGTEGEVIGSATNFPISLAYAATIHKAQGMTVDRAHVDLRRGWEHGQAYVALSRVRSTEGLTLEGWSPGSIRVDPLVVRHSQ